MEKYVKQNECTEIENPYFYLRLLSWLNNSVPYFSELYLIFQTKKSVSSEVLWSKIIIQNRRQLTYLTRTIVTRIHQLPVPSTERSSIGWFWKIANPGSSPDSQSAAE